MFNEIKLEEKSVNCKERYEKIKEKLEEYAETDEKFIQNAKMECNRIIKAELIEFNLNVSTLILSLVAFYVSLSQDIKISNPILLWLLVTILIFVVAFFSIRLHSKKQNAETIMFVLETMEK